MLSEYMAVMVMMKMIIRGTIGRTKKENDDAAHV